MTGSLALSVRYRITFVKDSPPSFEVVVYRDFEEPEGGEDESIMTKKITSIAQVHSKLSRGNKLPERLQVQDNRRSSRGLTRHSTRYQTRPPVRQEQDGCNCSQGACKCYVLLNYRLKHEIVSGSYERGSKYW